MQRIRDRIEKALESFGHLVFRNRLKTLFVMLLIIAGLISQLPKIRIDTSTDGILHESDPALVDYNAFREQFGRDELVIIAVKPPDVFDLAFLKKLQAFHEELEAHVPHIDDITSMVNARNTRGEGDRLIVEDLLETFPKNDTELAALKKRVMANPIYKNMMIAESGSITTIVIKTNAYSSAGAGADVLAGFEDETDGAEKTERPFLTDEENREVVNAVRRIAQKYAAEDFPLYPYSGL